MYIYTCHVCHIFSGILQLRVGESQPPDELVVVDQAIPVQVGLVDHLVHLRGVRGLRWVRCGSKRHNGNLENHVKIMGKWKEILQRG